MAAIQCSPQSSPLSSLHSSPSGRLTRRSLVQRLQSAPKYVDTYTGSPLGQALGLGMQSQSSAQAQSSSQFQSQSLPHAHPDPPPRWQGRGFGARHINDHAPFSLWNEEKQVFRHATPQEKRFIADTYNAERLQFDDYLMVIETSNPPKPVPLTVACIPTIFVPPGQRRKYMKGSAPYVGPRVRDPCPHLSWGRMQTPTNSQMADVISVLMQLVSIKRVHFFPTSIVVELVYGDGRVYKNRSLPAWMAGLWMSYHHDSVPFFESTTGSGTYADAVQSSTCGILLRKGASIRLTVAHHGFLAGDEVFHPSPDGDKIGDIVNRYPELDIAMVQLTLVDTPNIVRGSWFEVDGMSTGMFQFQYVGDSWEYPVRPPGHPKIPILKWERDMTFRIFGASSPELMDGLCGAPFVEAETGNVAGFFHLANGDWAECAAMDDLVAEGWEVA